MIKGTADVYGSNLPAESQPQVGRLSLVKRCGMRGNRQVGTGQRINVTMLDYSYSAATLRRSQYAGSYGAVAPPPPRPTQARTCRVFATIREPSRGATTTTYHVACIKGTDVDQPRNLAKSVTVE